MPNIPNGPGESEETFEYLPIQKWFMTKELKNGNHCNISFLILVREKLDRDRLKRALLRLSSLHDMLRAAYPGGRQLCRRNSAIAEIKELDIRGKTVEDIQRELTSWQSRFDPEQGYLWQSGILSGYSDGSERIFMALHHLLVDPLSLGIIRDDLRNLYEGREPEIKGNSYRQWVETVGMFGTNVTGEERLYWEKIRSEQEDSWPVEEPVIHDNKEPRCTRVEFTADVTGRLTESRRRDRGRSATLMLLSGLSRALCEMNGKSRNWITMEVPGRPGTDGLMDVSRTVGWFTAMYPIRLIAADDPGETITGNGEWLESIPSNGIGYGALYGYGRLPGVLFNFLGSLDWMTVTDWPICLREPSGECISPDNRFEFVVEMNGSEMNSRIGFWVTSSLGEECHDQFCAAFRRHVEVIAEYGNRSEGYGDDAMRAERTT